MLAGELRAGDELVAEMERVAEGEGIVPDEQGNARQCARHEQGQRAPPSAGKDGPHIDTEDASDHGGGVLADDGEANEQAGGQQELRGSGARAGAIEQIEAEEGEATGEGVAEEDGGEGKKERAEGEGGGGDERQRRAGERGTQPRDEARKDERGGEGDRHDGEQVEDVDRRGEQRGL